MCCVALVNPRYSLHACYLGCETGSYGDNCSRKCDHCKNSDTCNVMRMGARCQGFGHQYVMVRNQIMQSNTLYSKMSIMWCLWVLILRFLESWLFKYSLWINLMEMSGKIRAQKHYLASLISLHQKSMFHSLRVSTFMAFIFY